MRGKSRGRDRSMKRRFYIFFNLGLIGLCFLALSPGLLLGQEKLVSLQRLDLSDLPDVHLYISITDTEGHSVLGLTEREIRITIDDIPQAVQSLVSALEGGENLAVALLFDRSGSMRSALDETKAAAVEFIKRMSMGDRIAVISFDDLVRVDAEFTADKTAVEKAVYEINLGRDTALFDAVEKALEMLQDVPTNRQAVVILSDGRDTKSRITRSAILEKAKSRGVPIYTINLAEDGDQETLTFLSKETGGAAFQAGVPGELLTLYQKIAEQLHNQYLISFRSSTEADEQFHELKIIVQEPSGSSFETGREFIASKGLGVKREREAGLKRDMTKKKVLLWVGIGAFFGMLLGLLILIMLRIIRADINLLSPLSIALFLSAVMLGAIFGAFYILSK